MKLGISHNGQKSTCRKTIRIFLAGCARSATMVHVHASETFLPTPEASLMIPDVVVFTIFYH